MLDVERYNLRFYQTVLIINSILISRQVLAALRSSLDKRRWRLITELLEIYPISAGEKCLLINEVKLPNSDSFFGYEEEEIAAALGSVCHIIFMVSKYLDVRILTIC